MKNTLRMLFKKTSIAAAIFMGLWSSSAQLVSDLDVVYSNMVSPSFYQVVMREHSDLDGSSCDLSPAGGDQSKQQGDLSSMTYLAVYSMGVKYAGDVARGINRYIGGYIQLREALAGFQWIEIPSHSRGILSSYFMVAIPSNFLELAQLKDIVKRYSTFYIWPDQTQTINLHNLQWGNGIDESIRKHRPTTNQGGSIL